MTRTFIVSEMETDHSLRIGTVAGTLLSIIPNLYSGDVLKTIVLAAIGATVSFLMSLLFKVIANKRRK